MAYLLEWQYLIFELPFVFAFLYILLLATGNAPGEAGEADTDTDLDHDFDHDLEHDMDHGIEHHVGDTDHPHPETNLLMQVLSFFGIGKTPLSILAGSFFVLWGFIGWTSNRILGSIIPWPIAYVWVSIALAMFCAIFFTRYLAIGVSKVMPSTESYVVRDSQLVGSEGQAIYDITSTFGLVQVKDRFNNLHQVDCRVLSGESRIPQGSKVILFDYDSEKKIYSAATEEQFDELRNQKVRKENKGDAKA